MDIVEEFKNLSDSDKKKVFKSINSIYKKIVKKEQNNKKAVFIENAVKFMKKWNLPAFFLSCCGCSYDDGECFSFSDCHLIYSHQELIEECLDLKYPENLEGNQEFEKELLSLGRSVPDELLYEDSDAVDMCSGQNITRYLTKNGKIAYYE